MSKKYNGAASHYAREKAAASQQQSKYLLAYSSRIFSDEMHHEIKKLFNPDKCSVEKPQEDK